MQPLLLLLLLAALSFAPPLPTTPLRVLSAAASAASDDDDDGDVADASSSSSSSSSVAAAGGEKVEGENDDVVAVVAAGGVADGDGSYGDVDEDDDDDIDAAGGGTPVAEVGPDPYGENDNEDDENENDDDDDDDDRKKHVEDRADIRAYETSDGEIRYADPLAHALKALYIGRGDDDGGGKDGGEGGGNAANALPDELDAEFEKFVFQEKARRITHDDVDRYLTARKERMARMARMARMGEGAVTKAKEGQRREEEKEAGVESRKKEEEAEAGIKSASTKMEAAMGDMHEGEPAGDRTRDQHATPTATPAAEIEADHYARYYDTHDYGRVLHDSTFRPYVEEYDFIRFDPYSFSGAPLGGWGRATRSRLASLPIRLVVGSGGDGSWEGGFGGGLGLLFGGGGGDTAGGGGGGGEGAKEGAEDELGGGVVEGAEEDDGGRQVTAIVVDGDEDSSPREVKDDDGDSSGAARSSDERGGEEATSSSSSPPPPGVRRSTGPHFSIHDATGQRYVCRTYPEDELAVSSRIDSAFYPAVTVWDEEAAAAVGGNNAEVGGGEDENGDASSRLAGGDDGDELDDGATRRSGFAKKFQFSFPGGSGGGGDIGNLPDGIRASVLKMLRKLGMVDAAEALVAENRRLRQQQQRQRPDDAADDDVDGPFVHVEVEALDELAAAAADANIDGVVNVMMIVDQNGVVVDGLDLGGGVVVGGNDDELAAAGIADIIRAAALGAGIGGSKKDANKDGGGGEDGGGRPKESNGGQSSSATPPRLTVKEIYKLLDGLNGVCAQLHDGGWWSYEWCHQDTMRQFHVGFTNDSPPTLEVHDVTLIGHFNGEMKIIYPKGIYDGKLTEGVTMSVMRGSEPGNGDELIRKSIVHTASDDQMYASDMYQSSPLDLPKKSKPGHERGPIITQIFYNGDWCDEAARPRMMNVELRCCTKGEIHQWLESRKPPNTRMAGDGGVMEETPQAVLVSVREEATCTYTSRVCTPALCPRPVLDPSTIGTSASHEAPAKTKTTPTPTDNTAERRMKDPLRSIFKAIFGDEIADQRGELHLYFPDDATGNEFDELLRQAEEGLDFTNDPAFQRVKRALRANSKKLNIKDLLKDKDNGSAIIDGGGSMFPNVLEVKAGESIREILDKTLAKRGCLMKNIGW